MEEMQAQETVVDAPVDAGQSQETVTESQGETVVQDGVDAQSQQEPNYGQAIKAEIARREEQIRKKYEDESKQYQQHLERVAKYGGYETYDEMLQDLNAREQQAMIQAEAQKLGVPDNVVREHLSPLRQQMEQMQQQLQQYQKVEQDRQFENEVQSLKAKYDDFETYIPQMSDILQSGQTRSLEAAYKLATYEARIQRVAQQKEQEVLAQVTGRDQKQVLGSADAPNNLQFNPANMSLDEIRKLSERVQRGDRVTF